MAGWGSGYVTDTAYVHDFCRVQTPAILSLAALARGVAAPGGLGEPFTDCDLGCGQGFTANLVAAANPRAEVFAAFPVCDGRNGTPAPSPSGGKRASMLP
jgi:hypothetical protein